MRVGDRVFDTRVLKMQNATGTIKEITKEFVVVTWDNANGECSYTHEQSEQLEVLNE